MKSNVTQYPMKGIINNKSNDNYSYAHFVLQSICCLDTSKEFVNSTKFDSINPNCKLSREIYALIYLKQR
jgi:hypothetical protein